MSIASACWRDVLPIRAALLLLMPPNWEHVAKQLTALEYYGASEASLVTTRRVLWVELCGWVRQGELQAHGIPAGKKVLDGSSDGHPGGTGVEVRRCEQRRRIGRRDLKWHCFRNFVVIA